MIHKKLISHRLRGKEDIRLFTDPDSGIIYFGPFKGAFSYPGVSPGFICIFGMQDEGGRLREIDENSVLNMEGLVRSCHEYEQLYGVKHFYVNSEEPYQGYHDIFYRIARRLEVKGYPLQPSIRQDFGLAIQIIRSYLQQDLLALVEGGILENKVEAYHHTDPGDTKLPEKYFELQVLANVISSFPLQSLNLWIRGYLRQLKRQSPGSF
jgi:hypothetical protein